MNDNVVRVVHFSHLPTPPFYSPFPRFPFFPDLYFSHGLFYWFVNCLGLELYLFYRIFLLLCTNPFDFMFLYFLVFSFSSLFTFYYVNLKMGIFVSFAISAMGLFTEWFSYVRMVWEAKTIGRWLKNATLVSCLVFLKHIVHIKNQRVCLLSTNNYCIV